MRLLMEMALVTGALLAGSAVADQRPSFARERVVVRMTQDHRFDPRVVTIRPGDTVLWKNDEPSLRSVVGDPFASITKSRG